MDETYLRLEEEQADERAYLEWTAKHSEYMKPKEDKVAEVVNRISEWEAAAYAAHAQAIRDSPKQGVQPGPREPLAKAVDALRPDILEEDADHLAFSSFKDKYRRYFNASNFRVLTVPQQQAYLLSVLSDSLAIRISLEDTDSLEACLTKLTGVFDQRYPWIKKLMDCMRCKQARGQSAAEFITGKTRLQRESGMLEMSVQKLAMADVLASMEDPELIDEVLKLDLTNANLDTIWQAGVKYDTRQASKKALSRPTASAKRVKSVTCYKCGESGHFQSRCTKTVLCSICKSSNHCDSMHPKNKDNKSKVIRQRGEGRSRSQKDSSSGKSRDGRKSERGGKPGATPAPSPTSSQPSSREASRSPSPAARAKVVRAKVVRHKCSAVAPSRDGKTGPSRPAVFRSPCLDTPLLQCTVGKCASRQAVSVAATPDSGCTMGVARSSIVRQCGASITPTSATLEAANGASMKVLGKTTLYIKVDRVSVKKVDVLVSDDIGSDDLLLSWQNLITLRVLSADFPSPMPESETARCNKGKPEKDEEMESLHEKFEDVFSDRLLPGKRINMAPVDIKLENDAKPRAFYHCK